LECNWAAPRGTHENAMLRGAGNDVLVSRSVSQRLASRADMPSDLGFRSTGGRLDEHIAKVRVAGSNPVVRSTQPRPGQPGQRQPERGSSVVQVIARVPFTCPIAASSTLRAGALPVCCDRRSGPASSLLNSPPACYRYAANRESSGRRVHLPWRARYPTPSGGSTATAGHLAGQRTPSRPGQVARTPEDVRPAPA
jgi:hypothetical protein